MISNYYYPHVGGVERHVEFLTKNIKMKKNIKIGILTRKHTAELQNKERHGGIDIQRISFPDIKFLGLLLIWLKLLLKIRMILSYDLIHIHDVFIWYLPIRIILFWKPVYITFHGYESYPLPKKAIIIRRIAELLTKGNICVGKFIEKWYGVRADIVTYGAVDISRYSSDDKQIRYDAIFASRLDEQTGIARYVEAVKLIKDSGVDFSFLVLGEGDGFKETSKVATMKGFVNNPEKYYKQARFAFVSRYLAVLESFAAKRLVFAVYDNPLKKDYLYMTPYKKWIIIESSPIKLAEKINYYVNNPKKAQKYIDIAHQWVVNQTWEKMAGNYVKLWKE